MESREHGVEWSGEHEAHAEAVLEFLMAVQVLTQKTKGKCSFLMFCSVFLFLFSVLVLWRLFVLVPT